MLSGPCEILVGRKQYHIVPNTKLCQQSVDGTELDACTAAGVAQDRCVDVVIPVRLEERQGGKAFDNLGLRPGAEETL